MKNPRDEKEPVQNNNFMSRVTQYAPQRSWRTWLIGNPLPTADAPHQTVSKAVGLAIFGADALSSIAYAPQETLVILAAAGTQAFGYAFPISLIISVLLAIVTMALCVRGSLKDFTPFAITSTPVRAVVPLEKARNNKKRVMGSI